MVHMIDPDDPTVTVLLRRLQDLSLEQIAAGAELDVPETAPVEEQLAAQRRCATRQMASLEEQVRIIDSLLK